MQLVELGFQIICIMIYSFTAAFQSLTRLGHEYGELTSLTF